MKQVGGAAFRRQHPVGSYIVDLCCPSLKLIVEVDGDTHTTPGALAHDRTRTAWLSGKGYRVLRFWNRDVMHNLSGVLRQIEIAAVAAARNDPHPSSP
jgi:very-short-patch-repair endonuclease